MKSIYFLFLTTFIFASSCDNYEIHTNDYMVNQYNCYNLPDSLRDKAEKSFNACVKNANNMSDEEMEDVIPECRKSIYSLYSKPAMVVCQKIGHECHCCQNAVGVFKEKCVEAGYKY